MQTLYQRIGQEFITEALTAFYIRAFNDPIIGHFFFNKDRAELTAKQIAFTCRLLGATHISYQGKTLKEAHRALPLTLTHFRRRQVLMAEVLAEKNLAPELQAAWLTLEENLQPLIINTAADCHS